LKLLEIIDSQKIVKWESLLKDNIDEKNKKSGSMRSEE
jgi:hypothetical protein